MKTTFGRFVSGRLLLVVVALALLLGLTIVADLGSATTRVVSGSSDQASSQYRIVQPPLPDTAEIDRQVQEMDATRFGLGNNQTSPIIWCPALYVCAD